MIASHEFSEYLWIRDLVSHMDIIIVSLPIHKSQSNVTFATGKSVGAAKKNNTHTISSNIVRQLFVHQYH